MESLQVRTNQKRQVIDITNDVVKLLPSTGSGLVHVFVQHTTCAVTTADLDPGTDLDFLDFLAGITPKVQWRHAHNPAHTPAHLLSSVIGPNVTIPFADKQLLLGTWQRIVLVELDGPVDRHLVVNFITEKGDK
jgi:secondary thiamine-phosphate synthase enzyme